MLPSAPRWHGLYGHHLFHPFPALTVAMFDEGRSESGSCVGLKSNSVLFQRFAVNCSATALSSGTVTSLFPILPCRPDGSVPSEAYRSVSAFCSLGLSAREARAGAPPTGPNDAVCTSASPLSVPSSPLREASWLL